MVYVEGLIVKKKWQSAVSHEKKDCFLDGCILQYILS